MVSEFRKNKYLFVFNLFFDHDRNGVADDKDIDALIEKFCEFRGWKPGDKRYNETQEIWYTIWYGVLTRADKDKDARISIDEWIAIWDEYAKNPSAAYQWQRTFQKFMFSVEDSIGEDDEITEDEFVSMCSFYGLEKDEIKTAFRKAAKGRTSIKLEDYQVLWEEYFASDDPESAGNFIFGKVNF